MGCHRISPIGSPTIRSKMKALVYTSISHVDILERPKPVPGPDDVLVKIALTGICGSDLHGFLGHHAKRQPGLILGHETVGVVEKGPGELVGKRVVINPLLTCGKCRNCRGGRENACQTWRLLGFDQTQGAFAEYVAVPIKNAVPIPDHVPFAQAVLVEPLANAIHLLSMVPDSAGFGASGVILGGGTLGTLIAIVAKARGFNVVAVSEPNPLRADALKELGFSRIVSPLATDLRQEILKFTDGEGVAFAVDAVGIENTRKSSVEILRKGGTSLLLGLDHGPTTLDYQDIVRREIRLQGSFAFTSNDFADALHFIASGGVEIGNFMDVLPLEDGQQGFDRLAKDPGNRLKIALSVNME